MVTQTFQNQTYSEASSSFFSQTFGAGAAAALAPQKPARDLACLNALSHGGCAEKLFILSEDPAVFDTLLEEAFTEHQPATAEHSALVTDLVVTRWKLWRRQRASLNLEHQLSEQFGDASQWKPEHLHSVHLLDRYLTQAERAHARALAKVRVIEKDKSGAERWRMHLALQRDRIQLTRERFEYAKEKHANRLRERFEKEQKRAAASQPKRHADHAASGGPYPPQKSASRNVAPNELENNNEQDRDY
jgi:hypothetical protein